MRVLAFAVCVPRDSDGDGITDDLDIIATMMVFRRIEAQVTNFIAYNIY
jgi:hypothetical protein